MLSNEEIRQELLSIADSYEMRGEAMEMLVELVTYALYHEQVNIANTAKEMSLTDAMLMSSKIALCANSMYSVYRGSNPRVYLNVHFDAAVNKNKFDLLYEGNTFNLYMAEPMSGVPDGSEDSARVVETILSKYDIVDKTDWIETSTRYGYELTDSDGNTVDDISDDIQVFVSKSNSTEDMVEYPVTRLFSDHAKSYDDESKALRSKIFALTIPGYGVRLFKKGGFQVGSKIRVKGIVYSTMNGVNTSLFSRITIPGITLKRTTVEVPDPDDPLETISQTTEPVTYTPEVARQEADTIPYEANYAGRVSHEIQSNSDVNYLFSEVFINKVQSSTFEFLRKDTDGVEEDTIRIYYIGKPNTKPVNNADKEMFVTEYGPYFLNKSIQIEMAQAVAVTMGLDVVVDKSESIIDDVTGILGENFNGQLGIVFNKDLLVAMISKLEHVRYIKRFELSTTADFNLDGDCVLGAGQYLDIVPEINYIVET